jgi:general secretion pathway protein N
VRRRAAARRSALGLQPHAPRGLALALAGVLLGALVALLGWPPAAWLARVASSASGERVLLADTRGTLWSGSAVLVLTGGPGSRDLAALPGRLHWTLGLDGMALAVRLRQDCCTDRPVLLRLQAGLGRLRVTLPAPADAREALGHWPMQVLAGLGTPWNTLAPRGAMSLSSPGFAAESVQGRWRFEGRLDLALRGAGSRLTTLPVLGDYRLTVESRPDGGAALVLVTDQGALQLSGQGEWAPDLRFRGQATALPEAEAALANLLNIIGRRQGAVSLISIG